MIKVFLHGNLKRFSPTVSFAVSSLNELMRALFSQIPDLKSFLIRKAQVGAAYRVSIDKKRYLSETQLDDPLGQSAEVHITPVIKGASGRTGNIIKIIAGVIITAVALITGVGAPIAMIGISLALSGIMGLLSEPPKNPNDKQQEQKKSFIFNGATNSSGVNSRVPVIFGAGRCTGNDKKDGFIVGSMVAAGYIRSYYSSEEDDDE
jgi:predicted phage tail protein